MARILSVRSLQPRYRYSQEEVEAAVERWLPAGAPTRDKLLGSFRRAGIRQRRTVVPLEQIFHAPPFDERSRHFSDVFVRLGHEVVMRTLADGGWEPREFHSFVTVSCTGFMIPSPEAHIAGLLGLPEGVRRLPITELGCAAGAMGLGFAADMVEAYRRAPAPGGRDRPDKAILLAAEFPSLNFQRGDVSAEHVISAALFGDGVVAAIVGESQGDRGDSIDRVPDRSPRLVDRRSHLFPATTDLMGFDLRSSGFHIILSREIPDLIRSHLGPLLASFLADLGWRREGIRWWVLHPGGDKILQSIAELLNLSESALAPSREVLARWGNTSSAAVLMVLERVLEQAGPGDRGLLVAFGPGFCVEMVALQW